MGSDVENGAGRRGQTAVEYILLVMGAIVFIAVIASVGTQLFRAGQNQTNVSSSGLFNQVQTVRQARSCVLTSAPTAFSAAGGATLVTLTYANAAPAGNAVVVSCGNGVSTTASSCLASTGAVRSCLVPCPVLPNGGPAPQSYAVRASIDALVCIPTSVVVNPASTQLGFGNPPGALTPPACAGTASSCGLPGQCTACASACVNSTYASVPQSVACVANACASQLQFCANGCSNGGCNAAPSCPDPTNPACDSPPPECDSPGGPPCPQPVSTGTCLNSWSYFSTDFHLNSTQSVPADKVGVCLYEGANNSIFDCNSYAIQGSVQSGQSTPAIGILLYDTDNITVRNCRVMNFTTGISLRLHNRTTLDSDALVNNTVGVASFGGSYTLIANSTFTDNYAFGVSVDSFPPDTPAIAPSMGTGVWHDLNVTNNTFTTVAANLLQNPMSSASQSMPVGNGIQTHSDFGVYSVTGGRSYVTRNTFYLDANTWWHPPNQIGWAYPSANSINPIPVESWPPMGVITQTLGLNVSFNTLSGGGVLVQGSDSNVSYNQINGTVVGLTVGGGVNLHARGNNLTYNAYNLGFATRAMGSNGIWQRIPDNLFRYIDIDSSNLVDNQPVLYVIGDASNSGNGGSPYDGSTTNPAGFVACIDCTGTTFQHYRSIRNNSFGVLLVNSNGVTVNDVSADRVDYGVYASGGALNDVFSFINASFSTFGVSASYDSLGSVAQNLTVRRGNFTNVTTGVFVDGPGASTLSRNAFTNVTTGVWVKAGAGHNEQNLNVTYNAITNAGTGVWLHSDQDRFGHYTCSTYSASCYVPAFSANFSKANASFNTIQFAQTGILATGGNYSTFYANTVTNTSSGLVFAYDYATNPNAPYTAYFPAANNVSYNNASNDGTVGLQLSSFKKNTVLANQLCWYGASANSPTYELLVTHAQTTLTPNACHSNKFYNVSSVTTCANAC